MLWLTETWLCCQKMIYHYYWYDQYFLKKVFAQHLLFGHMLSSKPAHPRQNSGYQFSSHYLQTILEKEVKNGVNRKPIYTALLRSTSKDHFTEIYAMNTSWDFVNWYSQLPVYWTTTASNLPPNVLTPFPGGPFWRFIGCRRLYMGINSLLVDGGFS